MVLSARVAGVPLGETSTRDPRLPDVAIRRTTSLFSPVATGINMEP